METTYGARDIIRNPALLKIAPSESIIIEDKRSRKRLGLYLGTQLAEEFLAYKRKVKMLDAAKKIKESARLENKNLEGSLNDEL